jgi:hypothetical protein
MIRMFNTPNAATTSSAAVMKYVMIVWIRKIFRKFALLSCQLSVL